MTGVARTVILGTTVVGVLTLTACQSSSPRRVTGPPPGSTSTSVSLPAAPTTPAPTTVASTTVPPTSVAAPTTPAPAALTSDVLDLVDRSRPTVSHGQVIASSRALTTTVWLPAGPPTPRPLIVFAHGYSVGVTPYVRVCEAWARAGFVVAAPAFPLTDKAIAGAALDENDMVNQPADVRFVISSLLTANGGPAGPLRGAIDGSRIAVAGHSDGADTALAVTYLPEDRDARIRAAIVDAPDPLPLPASAAKVVSDVPLLLVHGDQDQIAPYSGSEQLLTQLSAPGWFLTLRGADHLSPIAGPSPWTGTLDRVTTDFLEDVFSNPGALGAKLATDVGGAPATLQRLG